MGGISRGFATATAMAIVMQDERRRCALTENWFQAFTKPALVQCRDPNLETVDARIVDRPLRPCGTSLRCTGAGAGADRPEHRPPDPARPDRAAVGGRARRLGDLRRGRPLGRQHEPVAVEDRRARRRRAYNDVPRRRVDPRLPSLQVGRGPHRRRRAERRTSPARARAPTRASATASSSRASTSTTPAANKGQALALAGVRATNKNIKAVVVLIGANDYGFADILETCVVELADVAVVVEELLPGRREHGPDVLGVEHHDDHQRRASGAFQNVKTAMDARGLRPTASTTILAQTYSAPLPLSGGFRYPETGFTRQTIGGCGAWNSDANWARNTVVNTLNNTIKNAVAGMSNVKVLDMVGALYGRRLCENTVGLLEEKGVSTWQSAGRRRQDRVGAPDPHAHHDLPAVPAAGGRAPELLGPARAAQLLPPGVQRRRRRAAAPARAAPGSTPRASPTCRSELGVRSGAWSAGSSSFVALLAGGMLVPPAHAQDLRRCGGAMCGSIERPLEPRAADGRSRSTSRSAATGRATTTRAADRRRRGRAGLPVDGHPRGVPRDLRAAAAHARAAAGRQPRDRRLGADRLQERAVVRRAHVRAARSRAGRGVCAARSSSSYGEGASSLFATAYAVDDLAAVIARAARSRSSTSTATPTARSSCRTSSRAIPRRCTR